MEVIIGVHVYFTKLHFLDLKRKFEHEYIPDIYHSIFIKTEWGTIKITRDGLIYLRTKIMIEDINKVYSWIKSNVLSQISSFDEEDTFFMNFLLKEKPSIIVFDPIEQVPEVYEKLGRKCDYTVKTKKLTKSVGQGLVIYKNAKYSDSEMKDLLEYQLLMSEYQTLIQDLLLYNKGLSKEISALRKKQKLRYKELPNIINTLVDRKREISFMLKKVGQLGEFIKERLEKCKIVDILEDTKSNNLPEMIRLNGYLKDQFEINQDYIVHTIELAQFIYRENEQKELNILQILFATSAIAAIMSLGAMPGARLFMNIGGEEVVGEIVAFSIRELITWTFISIVIGVFLFIFLNFVFLYAKKTRLVHLFDRKK